MPQLKDRIGYVDAHKTIQASFAALTGMQDSLPDYQLMGTALLLRVMCERSGLDVSAVLDGAHRVERDADDFFRREVKALRDYVDNEIRNWDPKSREVQASAYTQQFNREDYEQ